MIQYHVQLQDVSEKKNKQDVETIFCKPLMFHKVYSYWAKGEFKRESDIKLNSNQIV